LVSPGRPEAELRSDLFVLVILAVALTFCATIPTPKNENDTALVPGNTTPGHGLKVICVPKETISASTSRQ
jgi:hypothetical protein